MGTIASQITSLTIVYSIVYTRCRSKKTSKLCVTVLCAGNSPGTGEFPTQMASNAENVSIWWCHHYLYNTPWFEHSPSLIITSRKLNAIAYACPNLSWTMFIKGDPSVFFKPSCTVHLWDPCSSYRQTINISRTLVSYKFFDHSGVVGASPVGAAPTTSSFST